MSLRSNLLQQLAGAGITDPEIYEEGGIEELSPACVQLVSGGFGQQVGFGQAFHQQVGGGHTQDIFRQNIGPIVGGE